MGLPLWIAPLVGRSFNHITAGKIDQIPLFAGVDAMLRALREYGVALSVATSNAYENIRHVLTPEIADLMVRPQCSTSLFGKSTRVRNILRHTGVLPNKAIFIGDEIRDMDAAHDAGVHFGAVTWGYTSADARVERSPAEVFASVDEIVAKITRPAS